MAIPKSESVRKDIVESVKRLIARQTAVRERMRMSVSSDLRMTRERAIARHGFRVRRDRVTGRILIPKYYDPDLDRDLRQAEAESEKPWVTIGDIVAGRQLAVGTGVEVGKMAYGTGDIPFIRTSDIAEWTVKRDVKQGISKEIFDEHKAKAAVQSGDVVLVRDGTYLVGSSAMVSPDDVPSIICGGLYRLRCLKGSTVSPAILLGLLNLPIVRRQMRARQFTRDVIDTLGKRLLEIRIPNPDDEFSRNLGVEVQTITADSAATKAEIGKVIEKLEPPSPPQVRGRPGWSMR